MASYKYFHYLIEIAVKLNIAIEEEEKISTPNTGGKRKVWRNKLKAWIEKNYNDAGIKKDFR